MPDQSHVGPSGMETSMEPAGSMTGNRKLIKDSVDRMRSLVERNKREIAEKAVKSVGSMDEEADAILAVEAGIATASGLAPDIAADRLRSFVERIENLNDEKVALAADIREVYSEAKGNGFDTNAIRKVIKLRAMDKADREEQEAILELYANALGL